MLQHDRGQEHGMPQCERCEVAEDARCVLKYSQPSLMFQNHAQTSRCVELVEKTRYRVAPDRTVLYSQEKKQH